MIEAQRAQSRPGSVHATNSVVIDAIVTAWASLAGIKYGEVEKPMTTGDDAGIFGPFRVRAYDSGEGLSPWAASRLAQSHAKDATKRVTCGARRARDGQPCRAKSEQGKLRCKWHGGRSTGPRTAEGKARALANLKQNRGGDDGQRRTAKASR